MPLTLDISLAKALLCVETKVYRIVRASRRDYRLEAVRQVWFTHGFGSQ